MALTRTERLVLALYDQGVKPELIAGRTQISAARIHCIMRTYGRSAGAMAAMARHERALRAGSGTLLAAIRAERGA